NISSVAARTGSPGEYVAYAATKAALDTLTIGLARELAPHRVHVNAVAPGTIDTGIHARAGQSDRAARVAERIALKRPGQPDEIANAVAWLVAGEASYVTGSVLEVTGGLCPRRVGDRDAPACSPPGRVPGGWQGARPDAAPACPPGRPQ